MRAKRKNVLILGAAGRDFHDFNVVFRGNPETRVQAFTATQIPDIAGRTYPRELAGPLYPEGIPIISEERLPVLLRELEIDEVVLSYSDIPNEEVMARAAIAQAAGADFRLLGPRRTMLESRKPVLSVCATRTGCGRSQTARVLADLLAERGKRAAVIRHPMPYGDLARQRCQRFASLADLDRYHCTIEEREEYELHIEKGHLLFAGVDYEEILREAEKEADVILWDGGNNDLPFYRPTLHLVLLDPHRPGHELTYYPSRANLLMADIAMLTKIGTAPLEGIQTVRDNVRRLNPHAIVLFADSTVTVEQPERLAGKRVLVVEDGPTLTHGGMSYGAGTVAARKYGAAEQVDPGPYAVGGIAATLRAFPHLEHVLPAMGYGDAQVRDLEETIRATPCDLVLVGTPFDLGRVLKHCPHPLLRVRYELDDAVRQRLAEIVDRFVKG